MKTESSLLHSPFPILNQIYSTHASSYFLNINFKLFSHLHLYISCGLFPSGFSTKYLYALHSWEGSRNTTRSCVSITLPPIQFAYTTVMTLLKRLYTSIFFKLATCPAHLNLLDFITKIMLGEECRSQNSLRSLLPRSDLVFLKCNNFLQCPILEHYKHMFLPQRDRPSFTPT